MKAIVFLSLLEMIILFDPLWVLINRLPPKLRLPTVTLEYTSDGYELFLGGGTGDID